MRKRSRNTTAGPACSTRGPNKAAQNIDRRERQLEAEPTLSVAIVEHQPERSHAEGLTALSDALVLQMFDSEVGETLRLAYTMLQEHQERQQRRAARAAAADALRAQLAQLEDGTNA